MEMITIKQLAEDRGVSYEAVRKMISRHSEELEGHINKEGRTQYLDPEAVKIITGYMQSNTVIVEDHQSQKLKELEEENKKLLQQIIVLQQGEKELLQGREDLLVRIHDLEINLLEEKHKTQLLEMKIEEQKEAEPEEEEEAAAVESEQVQEPEKRSFWSRLFGRK